MISRVETNAAELAAALTAYGKASGKSMDQVLFEKSARFAFTLSNLLRRLAPGKGSIRTALLARLKSGGGVKVRASVREQIAAKYNLATDISSRRSTIKSGKNRKSSIKSKGKRLNIRNLMVRGEINVREKGRGFIATSSRFSSGFHGNGQTRSRFGPTLARASLRSNGLISTLRFVWTDVISRLSGSAAQGLEKPRAQAAIADALSETREDILIYLARKNAEAKAKAGLQ